MDNLLSDLVATQLSRSAAGDELNNGRLCKHHRPRYATIPLKCAQKTDNSPIARHDGQLSAIIYHYPLYTMAMACSGHAWAIVYWELYIQRKECRSL
ncbi:unnamed protein product [Danaus chrysippus]|uniref:(African queen) hypothetical protein n=1 Tax=Danaus chrysippus TaxID=151541 RepID=A0A8J2R5H9_9NEOP|nr:unnamed protein product [Danaus chrysippus]